MEFVEQFIVPKFNYWIYVVLMMIGMHAMIAKNNFFKKLIGMAIFQTAIILFYVSIGVKEGANIPILDHHMMPGEVHANDPVIAAKFTNPLPHVLMLTAIVVSVATLGLALAISQKIYREYGTLEEDDILSQIKLEPND
ncbi:MAG: cation:proton antiporter subunit C [Verrucomicrobia bacterium]|nr:cation:proton antiporter subunit C [Verrucomicrobiota bacterium]